MISEPKQYSVTIFNEEYTIVSDESEQHVTEATQLVNSVIQEITAKAPTMDPKRVAVLAAIRLASNVVSLDEQQLMRKQKEEALVGLVEQALKSEEPQAS